jgi:hypothetical protein
LLSWLVPRRADNAYRGHRLGLWCFGLLVLAKTGIGLGSIFNGYGAATSADGIPLDSFTPAGARTVLSLFALLGLSQVLICLVCLLVLARYRALVPVMFVVLLLYQLGRYLILHFLPIPRTAAPPGFAINLALLGMMIVGLALSLREPGAVRSITGSP